jgi:hypothetical protein
MGAWARYYAFPLVLIFVGLVVMGVGSWVAWEHEGEVNRMARECVLGGGAAVECEVRARVLSRSRP